MMSFQLRFKKRRDCLVIHIRESLLEGVGDEYREIIDGHTWLDPRSIGKHTGSPQRVLLTQTVLGVKQVTLSF